MAMANITVLFLNTRGLNSQYKRARVLELLHRKRVDVALLQQTHLSTNDAIRLQNSRYKIISESSDGSKTKGEAILVKRCISLSIERISSDHTGRLCFCFASIQGKKVAFVSIYAPTIFDPQFFLWLSKELLLLNEYSLIVGADMNTFYDSNLDRSNQSITNTQALSSKALRRFSI